MPNSPQAIDFLTCDLRPKMTVYCKILQCQQIRRKVEGDGDLFRLYDWIKLLGCLCDAFMVRLRIIGHQKGPTNTEYDQNL